MEDVGTQQTETETPRQRLARLINERRARLGLNWNEVADRAGITKEGLRHVRYGDSAIRPKTKRGIEMALGWRPGVIDDVLNYTGPFEFLATRWVNAPLPAELPPDAGIDLIFHNQSGDEILVEVKQVKGKPGTLTEFAQTIERLAHDAGYITYNELRPNTRSGEENSTIRGIEEDPNLPDEVKRRFIEAYELVRREADEAKRRQAG